jgi:hypothetical protein
MLKHQYHKANELPPNDVQPTGGAVWVYVFPSFHGGQHQTDSVLSAIAYHKYDAIPGSAHGRQGQAYGIMITDSGQCQKYVDIFLRYAEHRQLAGEQFWVTDLGNQYAPLFHGAPHNVSFPDSWKHTLERPADLVLESIKSYTKTAVDVAPSGQTTDVCC